MTSSPNDDPDVELGGVRGGEPLGDRTGRWKDAKPPKSCKGERGAVMGLLRIALSTVDEVIDPVEFDFLGSASPWC